MSGLVGLAFGVSMPCNRLLLSLRMGGWHSMSGSLLRKPAAVQAGLWAILVGVLGTLVYTLGSMTAMESHAGKHPQKWKTAAMSAISGCLSWVYYKWAIRDVPGGLGWECMQQGSKHWLPPLLSGQHICCRAGLPPVAMTGGPCSGMRQRDLTCCHGLCRCGPCHRALRRQQLHVPVHVLRSGGRREPAPAKGRQGLPQRVWQQPRYFGNTGRRWLGEPRILQR